jgi:signal transduction histidine kinase
MNAPIDPRRDAPPLPPAPPAAGGGGTWSPELVAAYATLEAERDRLRADLAERIRERDESGARFDALVEGNADGIIVVDEGGVVRFANQRAAELFGRSLSRLIGTPFGHPLASGQTTEIDLLPMGSAPVVVEMRVVQTEWEGRPACLSCLRDITDRKHAEANARELIRAEAANRAKNDLIATISHDLRTPLHSIIGYADLLEIGVCGEIGKQGRDYVRRIRSSAEHQVHLIDQLLTFSRLEAGGLELRPREVDVAAVAEEVGAIVEPLAEQAGLALRVCARGPLVLSTDPDALRQIVLNLATNAVKYTRAGEVRLEAAPDGAGAAIRVIDTGIGIAPEHLSRIFEPFWQVERVGRGAGLGLSIVRRLARSLGGDIRVSSHPDQGSTFTLHLPPEPPPAPPSTDGR